MTGVEPVEQHGVESAWAFASPRQVRACGGEQPSTLGAMDGVCGGAEARVGTKPHFDKNDRLPVLEYKIDFAESAPPVALDESQPLALEIRACKLFGPRSGRRVGIPMHQITVRTGRGGASRGLPDGRPNRTIASCRHGRPDQARQQHDERGS